MVVTRVLVRRMEFLTVQETSSRQRHKSESTKRCQVLLLRDFKSHKPPSRVLRWLSPTETVSVGPWLQ